MPLSRSARIIFLLAIDVLFFFVELIVGYAVGSLALIADSFHMLNDIMSLVVALYAIKLSAQHSTDSRYSYGWHRAEILAALVNGVFLLALCFSIFLEALERFFSTPEISNPRLIVFVGTLGLASNVMGLFLFHERGHSHAHPSTSPSKSSRISSPTLVPTSGETTPTQQIPIRTGKRSRSDSFSSLYGHPAATRASLVQTANEIASARSLSPVRGPRSHVTHRTDDPGPSPQSDIGELRNEDLVASDAAPISTESTPLLHRSPSPSQDSPNNKPHTSRSHGHSHSGSMNMRALVLHVLGDALGNVGVIATGLVIWLTSWSFKYYFDPIISLVITVIIFSSALPLVRSASFILLQGVPSTISLEQVRASILDVEGVLSLHELHIWQLSESKIVASVHVTASRNHDFMPIAAKIRKALHHHGIHSSTIQPEYHNPQNPVPEDRLKTDQETCCLILCPPDQECSHENVCCPPQLTDV